MYGIAYCSLNAPDAELFQLNHIPAVGHSGRFTSFLSALKFLADAKGVLLEGVEKYKGAPFKVAFLNKWMVIVSDQKMIDEIRQGREEELSFHAATDEALQIPYTLGPEFSSEHYHIQVVRAPLTRNLAARFADIQDEVARSFEDNVKFNQGDEWISLPAMDTVLQVVCRTSNRLFVGLPLCRNSDYCDLNIAFTMDVAIASMKINVFPQFLHPIVGPLFSPSAHLRKRASKHLTPLIQERMDADELHGVDREDRPNDMITWLLDEAPPSEKVAEKIAMRILVVNFAAIHTSSMSFTQALYYLAANPQYIAPLREEVESVIAEDGWSKAAVGKMWRIDSFLRESGRDTGLGIVSMGRVVKTSPGYTFSNGTYLPKGTFLNVASDAVHHSEEHYSNALDFNPFRFSDLREDGQQLKHQMVNTNNEYVFFGHGRHACPGRFFASNELKTMLAHVVLNYDVKLKDGILPPRQNFGANSSPDRKAHVMFRKRQL
ncbi:hypothetical protein HGRIS_009864 [Hohenbuehelia grisea]|uniref:Cytochrome P450 n=1 Tax=Hohenbuehelia grisea TaxID=104357 RepID=A0ABR3J2K2_9AGAR